MKNNAKKIILTLFSIFYFILSGLVIFRVNKLSILPFSYILIASIILILIYILIIFLIIHKNIILKILGYTLIIIYIVIAFWVTFQVSNLDKFFDNQTTVENNNYSMELIALKNAKFDNVQDLNGKDISTPLQFDHTNINNFIEDLNKNFNLQAKYNNVKDYTEAAENLLNKKTSAIILNSKYYKDIQKSFPDFKNKIIVVYSKKINEMHIIENNVTDILSQPFNVYLSGNDEFGDVSDTGRSDVNIIATVNPKTHKILLTSIPRDTYVKLPMANNAYDKLTHASNLGVKSSILTIENLLNIKISYYVRINFTSLIKIVDSIGGIDIYNPTEFNTYDIKEMPFLFKKGDIHLDGLKALAFSRERYFFNDERVRGMNQQRIIEGIISKITKPENIINFGGILANLGKVYDSNIKKSDITDVIKNQIRFNPKWNIQTFNINGQGVTGPYSYMIPNTNIFVLIPYKETVEYANQCIDNIFEGKDFVVDKNKYTPKNPVLMNDANIRRRYIPAPTNKKIQKKVPESTEENTHKQNRASDINDRIYKDTIPDKNKVSDENNHSNSDNNE